MSVFSKTSHAHSSATAITKRAPTGSLFASNDNSPYHSTPWVTWLKVYGSVMYCELCELQMLPDQMPGSPLTPHGLRPIASSAAAASAMDAAPAAAQSQVGHARQFLPNVPVMRDFDFGLATTRRWPPPGPFRALRRPRGRFRPCGGARAPRAR